MKPELALARHILRLVLERLGAGGPEAVPVGGVYLLDKLEDHGYAALKRRRARGRDRIILRVRPRPRNRSVALQLPVTLKAAKELAEAVRGWRVRAEGPRAAFDVTRSSLLERLAAEIARTAERD